MTDDAGTQPESTDDAADERDDTRERMARALRDVRREGRKVAAIYATVDAVLVALLADLACVTIDTVPSTLALSGVVALPIPPLAAGGSGVLVFTVEYVRRTRRPLVEQFEAANPEIREALRTARDAVTSGTETRMAARLYERVLADLRETSSVGLLDARRLAVTVVAIVVVSLLCVHVAIAGITVGVGSGPNPATASTGGGTGAGGGGTSGEYGGLQNASAVLGDATANEVGDDALNASVDASGGGAGRDDPESYDASGYEGGADTAVESQQAGYDDPSGIEDAELIRDYTLRIRSNQTQS